jgi:hypothetical protein
MSGTDWKPQPVPSYSPVKERVECSGIRANSLCQADFPPSEKFEAEGRSRKRGSMEKEKGVDEERAEYIRSAPSRSPRSARR